MIWIIVAAFILTTTVFLITYWKISSEFEESVLDTGGFQVDEKTLEKIKEALSRYKRLDAEELLQELKAIRSEVEDFLYDSKRGDREGEDGGDRRGSKGT